MRSAAEAPNPDIGADNRFSRPKKEDSSSPLPESSTYDCPPFRALDPQPYKAFYRRTDRFTLDRVIWAILGCADGRASPISPKRNTLSP